MTEQEAYEAGLRKLNIYCTSDGGSHYLYCDLRKDPAFAWRVLVAGKQNAFIWNALIAHPRFQGERLEDALHAAICELGRSEK